ncbi:MAG: glycosyltransferase [Chloroflexi bacterium]|nr:glycosyltransferase [Chloroflexota bacterium]
MRVKELIKPHFPLIFFYCQRRRIIKEINRCLAIPPDKYSDDLKDIYLKKINRPLSLERPRAYTEKIQWSKLYNQNPIRSYLSDKYLVRNYVTEKIGSNYLIPLYGVWKKFDDIDFERLPNTFVLKTNNGSGTNIVIWDKRKINYRLVKSKLDFWTSIPFGYVNAYELHYNSIEPLIIAEKYLVDPIYKSLPDYKILCFNGKAHAVWVDMNRETDHRRNVYNLDWKLLPWTQKLPNYNGKINKPKNFEKMIYIAETLSKGISHVRVDLYNINGCIFFGEMTFTNGSGLDAIYPDAFDFELGDLWDISKDRFPIKIPMEKND